MSIVAPYEKKIEQDERIKQEFYKLCDHMKDA